MTSKFWSSNSLEPKRNNRWWAQIELNVGGQSTASVTYLIKSFTRPKIEIGSNTIINNFTSETEIIATGYQWPDITITMIDVEEQGLNLSSAMYKWLTSNGYEPEQSTQKVSELFSNIDNQMVNLTLCNVNAKGEVIETWTFVKPQPTSIDFGGEATYDDDGVMMLTMGVTFVAAKYESVGSSAATAPPTETNTPPVGTGNSVVNSFTGFFNTPRL